MSKALDIVDNMEKVIIGKRNVIEKIVVALLVKGHVLIEDVPGVGKTQCVSALAKSINGSFNRIQFTPDVMASDITGFSMYNPKKSEFVYVKGTAFCNILLGDEINRASAKTQSSLLEVMEERQITVDGVTRKVPDVFMVLATQNPIECGGTNDLPEAQMDRFLFKLSLGYPTFEEEKQILDRFSIENPIDKISAVASIEDILTMQEQVEKINVSEDIKKFILDIVTNTRLNSNIEFGVSPRGSLFLYKASKAVAYLRGREYVVPEDVIEISGDVLCHRIILSSKIIGKDRSSSEIIKECVSKALHANSKVL